MSCMNWFHVGCIILYINNIYVKIITTFQKIYTFSNTTYIHIVEILYGYTFLITKIYIIQNISNEE